MGLCIIAGGSGAGKTEYIYRKIIELSAKEPEGRFKWEENMVSSSIFSPASLLRTIFLPVSSSTSGCGRESSEKIR